MRASDLEALIEEAASPMVSALGLDRWEIRVYAMARQGAEEMEKGRFELSPSYLTGSVFLCPFMLDDRADALRVLRHELLHFTAAPWEEYGDVMQDLGTKHSDVVGEIDGRMWTRAKEQYVTEWERRLDALGLTPERLVQIGKERPLRAVFQSQRGEHGSCLRACLATVLGLPEEAIPHFIEDRFHAGELPGWFGDRFRYDGSWFSFVVMWAWMMGYELRSADGQGQLTQPRAIAFGQAGRDAYHAVVLERAPDGAYGLAHDPVRDGAPGLTAPPDYYMELVPIDPPPAASN